MRFSIFHNLGAPGRLDEYATVMDEAREFALAAEAAGFWSTWYTEHHFGHEGHEITPNPVLMGADIAARTSTSASGRPRALPPSGTRCASPRTSPCSTSSPAAVSKSASAADSTAARR